MKSNLKKMKYTFKNWYKGEVALSTCEIVTRTNDEAKVCNWADIMKADIPKIKKKQKELFIETSRNITNAWIADFQKRYEGSCQKENLIKDEIFDFLLLLNGSNTEIIKLENHCTLAFLNHSLFFKHSEIEAIREYIKDIKKLGNTPIFDFIHSPRYPFQPKNQQALAEVYADACWNYLEWLQKWDPVAFNDNKKGEINTSKKIPFEPETKNTVSTKITEHNIFCRNMPISEVVDFFQRLKTCTSKNGKPYLTESQFESFIKKGFKGDSSLPQIMMNYTPSEIGKIARLFFQFSLQAKKKYGLHQHKRKTVELFVDCFENWDEESIYNRFRWKKTPDKW